MRDREAWCSVVHGVAKSQARLSHQTSESSAAFILESLGVSMKPAEWFIITVGFLLFGVQAGILRQRAGPYHLTL